MATQSTGRVMKLLREKGYGFLREDTGTEYFFHRASVANGGWEALAEGQAVRFTASTGPKGPRAEEVCLIRD